MSPDRFWIGQFLDMRDGHKCVLQDETCRGPLVIDHKSRNRDDWRPENLRWLCKSHNARNLNGALDRVSERENPLKDRVDYQAGSAEMQVNDNAEPSYQRWIDAWITQFGYITKKEAIRAGARVCEVSVQTSRRYLEPLISIEGPYYEVKDRFKRWVIKRRRGKPQGEGAE